MATLNNDLIHKVLLCIATIIILTVTIYCVVTYTLNNYNILCIM